MKKEFKMQMIILLWFFETYYAWVVMKKELLFALLPHVWFSCAYCVDKDFLFIPFYYGLQMTLSED